MVFCYEKVQLLLRAIQIDMAVNGIGCGGTAVSMLRSCKAQKLVVAQKTGFDGAKKPSRLGRGRCGRYTHAGVVTWVVVIGTTNWTCLVAIKFLSAGRRSRKAALSVDTSLLRTLCQRAGPGRAGPRGRRLAVLRNMFVCLWAKKVSNQKRVFAREGILRIVFRV